MTAILKQVQEMTRNKNRLSSTIIVQNSILEFRGNYKQDYKQSKPEAISDHLCQPELVLESEESVLMTKIY